MTASACHPSASAAGTTTQAALAIACGTSGIGCPASIDAAENIVRHVDIAVDHPAFAGHFPGQPILPGAALLAEVLEAARSEPRLAARMGATPQLGVVKFLSPVLPGARVEISCRMTATGLDFSVSGEAGRLHASGQFSAPKPA